MEACREEQYRDRHRQRIHLVLRQDHDTVPTRLSLGTQQLDLHRLDLAESGTEIR